VFAQQEKNPLLGRWTLAPPEQQEPNARELLKAASMAQALVGALGEGARTGSVGVKQEQRPHPLDQIEFTRTLVRQQSQSRRVEYEVEGKRVTVIDSQGQGTDWQVNGNLAYMMMSHPMYGEVNIKYLRAR
jgi:hypothetical protein